MQVLNSLTLQGSIEGAGVFQVGTNNTAANSVTVSGRLIDFSYIFIHATTATFSQGSNISVNGRATAAGPGFGTRLSADVAGGGYGGSGSGDRVGITGLPYGSYITPSDPGSRGGTSVYDGGLGGNGGGVINITTTNLVNVIGTISSNGNTGSLASGGGSGGSIFIRTATFSGSGTIQANGGAGSTGSDNSGGAGAGGRIAIHCSNSNGFSGAITAYGGLGRSGSNFGGPGTVYIYNYDTGNKKLIIANLASYSVDTQIITTPAATRGSVAWLIGPEGTSFEFDEIVISGKGGLAIYDTSSARHISVIFFITSQSFFVFCFLIVNTLFCKLLRSRVTTLGLSTFVLIK